MWPDLGGAEVSDVGGNLLGLLEAAGVDWLRLRRLNRADPHPLFFGVYGDDHGPLVYHHGAGFRDALSRLDLADVSRARPLLARAVDRLPPRRPFRRLRGLVELSERDWSETVVDNNRLNEEWFERLARDPEAWR
jgi:hypothetical protein